MPGSSTPRVALTISPGSFTRWPAASGGRPGASLPADACPPHSPPAGSGRSSASQGLSSEGAGPEDLVSASPRSRQAGRARRPLCAIAHNCTPWHELARKQASLLRPIQSGAALAMIPAQDLRFAVRALRRSPGFGTVIVLILALGIGANTAMFTLVNDILLKPLPSPEGHRIMHLGTNNLSKGISAAAVSYPDFLDWRSQSTAFSELALLEYASFSVSDNVTAAEAVEAARLTANAFRTLRVAPLRGRDFQPGEDQAGAPPVVLLGYGIWMRRYGGDPAVVGKTIRVDGAPASVIGIMPEGMQFPSSADMWMPLVETADARSREARRFEAFGRLRDGFSIEQAQAEMEGLGRRLESAYPTSNQGVRPAVTPYTQRAVRGELRAVLVALQGAVGFLLLVVCANAANLLLSRSLSRTREIAIRTALGASRGVLVRQLLIESLLYAALGGALGLLLAYWGVRAFNLAVDGTGKPYWLTFAMDYRVFGFLALVVTLTGVVFGLAPALQLLRAGVNDRLKEGGRAGGGGKTAHRLAGAFVVAQLSMTLVLLVGFGLMARSIVNIFSQTSGFDTDSVLTLRLRLPAERYPGPEERRQFQETLLAGLRRLPGVESAAIASHLPLSGSSQNVVEAEGYPLPPDGQPAPVATVTVGPDYFRTLGIGVSAGRPFSAADGAPGQANAMVNRRFAAIYWPGQEPLGKRLRITRADRGEWFTVTGISTDVPQNLAGTRDQAAVVYLPNRAAPLRSFQVALRTSIPPASLSNPVRAIVQAADPDLPVSSMRSMREVVRLAEWPCRVFGSMFAILGLVASALAGLGVYSVMAYSVGMRTREIGMRMALGATGSNIRAMVVARGLHQVALALAIGLTGALALTRGLSALLVGVSASDPLTFVGVASLQTALALLACYLPARRAARVDPVQALREQ